MIGERVCDCCGAKEGRGCVRGLTCGCPDLPRCPVCDHCDKHHVPNCNEGLRHALRIEQMIVTSKFREKHNINIFESGATK